MTVVIRGSKLHSYTFENRDLGVKKKKIILSQSPTASKELESGHGAENWAAKGFRTWGILRWKEKFKWPLFTEKTSVIIYNRLGLHLGILLEHLLIQHVSSPWGGQNPEETSMMWLLA